MEITGTPIEGKNHNITVKYDIYLTRKIATIIFVTDALKEKTGAGTNATIVFYSKDELKKWVNENLGKHGYITTKDDNYLGVRFHETHKRLIDIDHITMVELSHQQTILDLKK